MVVEAPLAVVRTTIDSAGTETEPLDRLAVLDTIAGSALS